MTFLATIFVFLFVILFHEFGHFAVAKAVGIRVNEFSIGMGPKILQKKKGETSYTLRLLPIGGYVAMEGEDEGSQDPRGFSNVSPWHRILVVAAGAFMNFVLAIIVFSIVFYSLGFPNTKIEETIDDTPAYEAGMVKGEEILEINNKVVDSWNSIVDEIGKSEKNIHIKTKKNDEIKDYNLELSELENGRKVIGIVPMRDKSFLKSIKGGFLETGNTIKQMFTFIKMMVRGEVGREGLSGPVGIVQQIGESAKLGIDYVLLLMGLISVNLGFINLLPLPALDGSKIVFILIEIIRGKPIDPDKEGAVHFIGFLLLMGLMIFVTYSDISKLIMGR